MKKRHGPLIVIEGIDQSGKRTQARLLANEIRRHGFSCIIWDFPDYKTILGKHLNAYLKGKERPDLHVVHLLYAANKWEVAERINSLRRRGIVVIANRYTPSNLAYGASHGLSLDWLTQLEADLPSPTHIFILDVLVKTSFGRKTRQRDVHEQNAAYLERVRKLYLRLAKQYNWTVINGESGARAVHRKLWKPVTKILGIKE